MNNNQEIRDYAVDQYENSHNLQTRINLWDYGTNPQPITQWIYSHFNFKENQHILELGTGTGKLWKENLNLICPNLEIILSDFSTNMIDTMKSNLEGEISKFLFQKIEVQHIPFPDPYFDHIIACHMLYHVPQLSKAVDEILHEMLSVDYKNCAATRKMIIKKLDGDDSEGFKARLQHALSKFREL